MTLIEYLQSLPELAVPGSITAKTYPKGKFAHPYVVIENLGGQPVIEQSNANNIDANTVQVSVLQQVQASTRDPDTTAAIALWHKIRDAVYNVDAVEHGSFVEAGLIETVFLEPEANEEFAGDIFGFVRFSIRRLRI